MTTDTRNQSWDKILAELNDRQKAVLKVFLDKSNVNYTAWEIADMRGWLVHGVRPRLNELERLGVLEICGVRFYEPTGRNEHIYRVRSEYAGFDDDGQALMKI